MTNEMIKALLMVALILAIELTVYNRRVQELWHRTMRGAPKCR